MGDARAKSPQVEGYAGARMGGIAKKENTGCIKETCYLLRFLNCGRRYYNARRIAPVECATGAAYRQSAIILSTIH